MANAITKLTLTVLFSALAFCAVLGVSSRAQQAPAKVGAKPSSGNIVPSRKYQEGEKLSYHMKGTNHDRARTVTYEVQADGTVKRDADGRYVEEYSWSRLLSNGAAVALDPAEVNFRQTLSLEPNYPLSVPDLSHVIPLIGPITDLLTLYADMSVARNGQLALVGDHYYFKHGTANSWADGSYVVLGQDSVDFDITLAAVNTDEGSITVRVRHLPPENPQISVPADWMRTPVADTRNNWVQVSKMPDGKYAAEVGKETFDVELRVSMANGRILSGSIDNPVEVIRRECTDSALKSCGEPVRYQIRRNVEVY